VGKLRAFLSCSDDPADKDTVTFFERLLESLGFEPYRASRQGESGSVDERIRAEIRASPCLAAVMTRRKQSTGGEWEPPIFVAQEIAIAYGHDIPIMAFAEEGVSVEGITPRVTTYERFNRDGLIDNAAAIVGYLCRTKEALLARSKGRSFVSDHVRKSLTSRVSVDLDGTVRHANEITIESISEQLASVEHELSLLSPFKIEDFEFDFFDGSTSSDAKVTRGLRSEGDKAVLWYVTFSPPLGLGQTATYSYEARMKGLYPLTQEAAAACADEGDEARAHEEWIIVAPTEKLDFCMRFPRGYAISAPRFSVLTGLSDHVDKSQVDALRRASAFSAARTGGEWELRLVVSQPRIGSQYRISWQPPTQTEYDQLVRGQAR
jgi:hypothetical protein